MIRETHKAGSYRDAYTVRRLIAFMISGKVVVAVKKLLVTVLLGGFLFASLVFSTGCGSDAKPKDKGADKGEKEAKKKD